MSITYEDALSTLKSMFADPWTPDHLDFVLRHYEGHMENTVESILGHGDNPPEELIARLKSSKERGGDNTAATGAHAAQISMDEQLARQLAQEGGQQPGGVASSSSSSSRTATPRSNAIPPPSNRPTPTPTPKKKGRGTPTDLPTDFLRIPGRKYDDIDADEALARMLQDDLFTEELANNPEFAHLARGRLPSRASRYNQQPRVSTTYQTPDSGLPQGPNIMDKISELGENAKRRLALLAAQWNARDGRNAVNERRGLLDGAGGGGPAAAEEEVSFVGQDVEMSPMQGQGQGKKDK